MFIGQYSIVNEHVQIGSDSKIWHFCNLFGRAEQPVIIGNNTQVGSYSEIKPGVKIGDNCRLQSYIFIPEGIIIENFVFIGPGVKFMNDSYPSARKTFSRAYAVRRSLVREHACLGGGSIIGPGVTIGRCAVVGMGSNVVRDVCDYAVAVGNPAKKIGDIRDEKYQRLYPEFKDLLE